MRRVATLSAFLVLALPAVALASSTTDFVSELAGLFYVIIGLTLVAAFLFMAAGVIMWLIRLGTSPTYRDDAIRMMEWGVATLFALVLVLAVVEFIQRHTEATLYIIGIAIILLLIWLVVTSGVFEGGKKDEE
ncbi:MAG TPA: hypothetical protein VMH91_02985 [Candidatus Paceibacterota bacterium]|nr:hypothetical protein [Candidatus Paceibacterota bacterium]